MEPQPNSGGLKNARGEREYTKYNFLQAFDNPPFTGLKLKK